MNLEQAIIDLESCLSKVTEVANSKVYQLAVKEGHPNLKSNLENVEQYLECTLHWLGELLDE